MKTSFSSRNFIPNFARDFARNSVLCLLLAFGIYAAAEDSAITPPENLVTQGIPAIPQSLAETVGCYTENREAFQTDWHPTRREMVIGTRFGNTYQAHVVAIPWARGSS